MKRTVLAAVLIIQGDTKQGRHPESLWMERHEDPEVLRGHEWRSGKARARKILEWRGRGDGEESVGQSPVNQSSINRPVNHQSRVKQPGVKQTTTGESPLYSFT